MAEIQISGLDPNLSPALTDVVATDNILTQTYKNTWQQILDLFVPNLSTDLYETITVSTDTVLTNPCPQVIRCDFTTVGHSITLPPATLPGGQPNGKLIYFKIAPTNTQLFDINTADGSTFIANAGLVNFAISYSTNGNINGTPIDIFYFAGGALGTMASQNADSVAITGGTIDGVAIGATVPAAGNFTGINGTSLNIEASSAGGNVQGAIINDSAAANSSASMFVGVADITAGDATYSAFINGDNLWTWGLDNSDGDAWVLSNTNSLGSGNAIRVSQINVIDYPAQPCFMAYVNAQQSNVTGDNTTYNITGAFFTERFDQSNSFSNGTFTAPQTGKYQFNLTIILVGLDASATFEQIDLVTSNATYTMTQINAGAARTSPGLVNSLGYSASVIVDMDVGDTAFLAVTVSGTTKTVSVYGGAPYTMFSGSKVA